MSSGSVDGISSSSVSQIVFMASPQDSDVKRHVLTRAPEIKGAVAIIFHLPTQSTSHRCRREPAESPIASAPFDIGVSGGDLTHIRSMCRLTSGG